MSQPRKKLVSSFALQNETLFTTLLLFCLQIVFLSQKYTLLLSLLQKNDYRALYSQQWTQKDKLIKIETPL